MRFQSCDGHLRVILRDWSFLFGMFACVRLTKQVEYDLSIDFGTTAVIKLGLLTNTLDLSHYTPHKEVSLYLSPVTFDVVERRLHDLWEINI